MAISENSKQSGSTIRQCSLVILAAFCFGVTFSSAAVARQHSSFASAEEAVTALVTALKADDTDALTSIFGPQSEDLVSSGDPVADNHGREQFVIRFEQKNRLGYEGTDKAILYIGDDEWPFAVPIVKNGVDWRFDGDEGLQEMLARRIGRNELDVIQVCLAYVDAQREYALQDRNGDGLLAYARKFMSEPGKQDGLFWEAKEGESPSPLGPQVVAAQAEGYVSSNKSSKPVPYHGYCYRILEAQGPNAPGGAYDYLAKEEMLGGFALVAYPAEYGASGVMTFIVNHDGVVYQQDLGKKTAKIVRKMNLFDPDSAWEKVEEEYLKPEE